ncbi:MAG: glutamate formimidoyltransferase [Candidatus Eisenbacteria bacterium]|uniref:Formimidoyltransferase-cyclodeaminase n=1 Tax=Eiseniibacteriota bacterium TaxID=2212470 RepID=A0A937X808_UNCEI|nr:glutamate formimidoyltransferase [Candidatus Eisenbacteria bacterium]
MAKLVECVPNISEGRDQRLIQAVAGAAAETEGVTLLDVDPGADTHRTVITFVGEPDAVLEGAFRLIRKAAELIDMTRHSGAHPRQGATDVCPFVPVAGVTMEECVELARRLGERVGRELEIPVFLYEQAATRPERRSLADIRTGEYEAWPEKLARPEWTPDYGPARFLPRTGAVVIGAREFLIAYNVDLDTRDRELAHRIALQIRETGRLRRDEQGRVVLDEQGRRLRQEGRLRQCRAVGWYIDTYGQAQVSINLTDYKVTPIHLAFDTCREVARSLGLRVTGSEIVGLVPLEALLMAGRHYLERQGRWAGVPEPDLVDAAVRSLGLNDVAPFKPEEKIIEYAVRGRERKPELVALTCRAFADELSRESPAPGGGSVAALCGALGAGLAAMVAALTRGKEGYEEQQAELERTAGEAQRLKDEFLADVDRDTASFNRLMAAFRMKKKTPEEQAARDEAIRGATEEATRVPLGVLRRSVAALALAETAAGGGLRPSISDAGVAGLTALACAEGAFYNVRINLKGLAGSEFTRATRAEADSLLAEARRRAAAVAALVMREID